MLSALLLRFPLLFSLPISQVLLIREFAASIFNRGWRRRSSLLPQTKQSSAGVVFNSVFFCGEWRGSPVYMALLVQFM